MSEYRFHDNIKSGNINSLNNVWNYTVADDRSEILTWLSPLEPRLRHKDIQESRVKGVGEWVLQTEEFKNWYAGSGGSESGNAVLFCYGDPGVGKTFISSLVIDKLCDQVGGQNATVLCFYFDFAARKEQSPTSVLGAPLKQLVRGLEATPKEISLAYQGQKNAIGGRGPQLADIVKLLYTTASEKPTFICIDALDECVTEHRAKILGSLDEILQRSPGTRIFVTGRPHIETEVGKRISGRGPAIRITPRRDEIISYLHSRLDEDATPDAMDSSLKADILRKIPEDISEIFLLVSLSIDAILQETTISRRRQKLNRMTDGLGLGGAYGGTLSRIKGQGEEKSRLAMAALMWISHAERPLKVNELRHALGVEIGSLDLDGDNVPSIGTLLTCCQGLVSIDKETNTVRLIHFTLHEYLRAHPQLFSTTHSTMAETCLSYLNSHQVKALSTSPSPDLRGTPFLEYASLYWGIHAKQDLSAHAEQLALKLFEDYSNHISIKLLLDAEKPRLFFPGRDKYPGFSGLHCASFFGIVKLVANLVEVEGCDTNQADCLGGTPLVWAAWNGHEGVAEELLSRGDVDPNKRCIGNRTPLLCASWQGHEAVVNVLLRRNDTRPDEPETLGRTPLWCAAEYGREGVVKILLERDDVDADKLDIDRRTPLSVTAQYGHERIVKVLLGRDGVNAGNLDKFGRTPLWGAAQAGHGGIVKILLGRGDVRPDEPDINDRTPLWYTAFYGYEEVVETLLERSDVNPNKPDAYGRTPLWGAAQNGHEGVVKMLLGRSDVNPDKPDIYGQTPLWGAAQNGHEGVVKILLGRSDVNPDKPDIYGRTLRLSVASSGHVGVIALLWPPASAAPSTV